MLNFLCTKYGKSSLTVAEAAVELGVSAEDVQVCIANGSLQTLNVGSGVLIPIVSIINLLGAKPTNLSTSLETAKEGCYTTTTSEWETNVVEEDTDMVNGSVTYVKGSDRWIVQLDLGKTPEGKRIRKSKSFKTEDEARDALAMELAKLYPSGITEENRIPTYEEIAKDYFSIKRTTARDRTWDTYRAFSKYSREKLGNKPVNEVSEEDFIMLFNELAEEYVDSTLKKTKTSAGIVFDYAIKNGLIKENPAKKVKKLPKSKVTIEDDGEKSTVDRAIPDDLLKKIIEISNGYEPLEGIISLFVSTGMRPGELRALKIKDIDFEENTIFIRRAASKKNLYDENGKVIGYEEYIGDTKNGEYGHRKLAIPRKTLELVMNQHNRMITSKDYNGDKNTEFLFPGNDGDFLKAQNLQSRWVRFKKKLGVDITHRLYDFRHTMCTNLVLQGVPIPIVQKVIGDNTAEVVTGVYTHINSGDMFNAMGMVHEKYNSFESTKCQQESTEVIGITSLLCDVNS